ncbi:Rha family transcriptional regulator [Salipaludibacillus sp. CF4.18]|uniref:Rha family transcriptional regulator n=1 Tax=Salipaludibacillus sp. CF4.18 TaxID=3373081 RepID=UPI003EE659EC
MTVKELVYTKGDQVVTDSITLAAAFEKRHDKVLRDIRNIRCSEKFGLTNFGESKYQNKQGRTMPMFILTYEGFSMVAMGYTGEKAIEFKERFINDFKGTRSNMESRDKMVGSDNVSHLIESYENQITIRSAQQRYIQSIVQNQIHSLFPEVKDAARRKYYSKLYQDLKVKFSIQSYRDIRLKDYESAKVFIHSWKPLKLNDSL